MRNQGVLLRGVNTAPNDLLELCFMLLDHAKIMPYYFYMCDMIPNAEHWRTSVAEAQDLQYQLLGYMPGFATPRVVCDVPFVGKRWVHMLKDYDRVKGISYWTKNYRTGIEYRRPGGAHAPVPVLRPDLHPARGGPGSGGGSRSSGPHELGELERSRRESAQPFTTSPKASAQVRSSSGDNALYECRLAEHVVGREQRAGSSARFA